MDGRFILYDLRLGFVVRLDEVKQHAVVHVCQLLPVQPAYTVKVRMARPAHYEHILRRFASQVLVRIVVDPQVEWTAAGLASILCCLKGREANGCEVIGSQVRRVNPGLLALGH